MNQKKLSILLGLLTITLWGSLATFSRLLIHLPPFYQLGVAFILGGLFSLRKPKEIFPSLKLFLWGTLGYFAYHFFLFYAFRYAPAVEANLINYLWPLLLVLLTPLFYREKKLRFYHVLGGLLAVLGCVVLLSGNGLQFKSDALKGYLLAFAAAWTWPLYSLTKKKMPSTSVWAIGGFCFGAGILCLITHALIEPLVRPIERDLFLIFVMGIGPFGIAFYTWDLAMEKGDPRVIGALTYLTPILSTLGLVIFTGEKLNFHTFVAMGLIIGGASTGLLDLFSVKIKPGA
jgi:drug/metabolite transporter (DMT)-like permease